MRDIKFRAYDNDSKEMLYNVQNTYDYSCTNDNKVMEDRFADLLNNPRYEVMQYAELKDKNNVEIYEGDILEFKHKNQKAVGNIVYENGCYFAIIENQKCWIGQGIEKFKGKIIGNIYDNPELLEGDK